MESELGEKFEHKILCELTNRQKILYYKIEQKLSLENLFQLQKSKEKVKNLMNLVMQFWKVCNHPDLFERKFVKTSFMFHEDYLYPNHYFFDLKA